jgi:putative ABC transport system ATP-binding protein
MVMRGASVKLEGITVVFNKGTPNETVALRDVNLEIQAGSTVVIQGGNGSGKSTLLKVIAGIYRPTEGKVFLDGEDVTGKKDYTLAKKISYVHQDPLLGTAPNLTLNENLALTLPRPWWWFLPYGLGPAKRQKEALQCTGLNLHERLGVQLNNFSGGQRQAIAIGMAFSREKRLVLLDEFTASLDRDATIRIIKLVKEIGCRYRSTIMLIMHSDVSVFGDSSRYIYLNKGSLVG